MFFHLVVFYTRHSFLVRSIRVTGLLHFIQQNERLANAREADFDDDGAAMLEHLVAASDAKHGGKRSGGKGSARRPRDEEEAMLQGMNRDLDSIAMRMDGDDDGDNDQNGGSGSIESIARDLSSLPRAKRLELLMADAPELAPLAEDLKKRWAEIRDELAPALAMLRESCVELYDCDTFLRFEFRPCFCFYFLFFQSVLFSLCQ